MERPRFSLPPLSTPGEVSTFYSHKGGCGRSMALANLAVLLASGGQAAAPTLMVDWDLDAPGLHQYFPQHDDGPGVLELFEACRAALLCRDDEGRDSAAVAREVLEEVGWAQYLCRVDPERPLYLMRAGRQDASYARRLAGLAWEEVFDLCPAIFRCFAECLGRHFRHVLVDSSSGRADMAGICTTLLPTRLVLLFSPNRQNLEGLTALVRRATLYRRSHEEEQRPLLVYPLPARIDMEDGERRSLWRRGDPARDIAGYQPLFEQALGEAYGIAELSLESYFDEVQLPQLRELACGEPLPALHAPGGDRYSLTRALGVFREWLEGGHPPWRSRAELPLLEAIAAARQTLRQEGAALCVPLAQSLERLGGVYCQEHRLWQALQCFQESRNLLLQLLGPGHPDTRRCTLSLAALLARQGRLDEARRLQEEAARDEPPSMAVPAPSASLRPDLPAEEVGGGDEWERRQCALKVQQERRAYRLNCRDGAAPPLAPAMPLEVLPGGEAASPLQAKAG